MGNSSWVERRIGKRSEAHSDLTSSSTLQLPDGNPTDLERDHSIFTFKNKHYIV